MCEELLEPYDIYECSKCRDGLKEENGADLVHSHALRELWNFPDVCPFKEIRTGCTDGRPEWVKVKL